MIARICGVQPHYVGHRKRLRARLIGRGAESLADYELLELVLFAAIPRCDVKPYAKELIERFGSFADAIAAPRERLKEFSWLTDAGVAQMKIVEAAAVRLAQTRVVGKAALSSWNALLDYCAAAMARSAEEEFRVLFLDRKNVLIQDRVMNRGTVDHAPVYPREIVKLALEISASALILVHNYPSRNPSSRSITDHHSCSMIEREFDALESSLNSNSQAVSQQPNHGSGPPDIHVEQSHKDACDE